MSLAEVPTPTRGSGPVSCSEPQCTGHRRKCLFGGRHLWMTWYEDGKLVRTADTYRCSRCGGICTGEETVETQQTRCTCADPNGPTICDWCRGRK